MTANERFALRLTISGRVQGVGYRAWCQREALALGLDGWVRNRIGGVVEVLATGNKAAVEELARLCAAGPPAARVDKVETQTAQGMVADGFRRLPTV